MKSNEFVQIVFPFKDKIFRLAKRLLISVEEAEDVTQEIITRLWDKQNKISEYSNIEAFAMTMTKNYCLDQLKSKRAATSKLVSLHPEDQNNNLVKKIETDDTLHWIEKIIGQLPEQQQLIVQMRDVEGYDFDEISEIMDMNPATIRVALSRARKTIREQMTKIDNYGIRKN